MLISSWPTIVQNFVAFRGQTGLSQMQVVASPAPGAPERIALDARRRVASAQPRRPPPPPVSLRIPRILHRAPMPRARPHASGVAFRHASPPVRLAPCPSRAAHRSAVRAPMPGRVHLVLSRMLRGDGSPLCLLDRLYKAAPHLLTREPTVAPTIASAVAELVPALAPSVAQLL